MGGHIIGYCAAALCMAVSGAIYGRWKGKKGNKELVFKALATSMAVILALEAAWNTDSPHRWLITAGLVLCMAADVLLELKFLCGVVAFGCAHICFLWALLRSSEIRLYTVAMTAAMYLIFLAAFAKCLPQLGALKVPAVIYPALLCGMAALAVTYGIQNQSFHAVTMAAGGICFVVSDFILARRYLMEKKERWYGIAVLVFYYSAVYLIAL